MYLYFFNLLLKLCCCFLFHCLCFSFVDLGQVFLKAEQPHVDMNISLCLFKLFYGHAFVLPVSAPGFIAFSSPSEQQGQECSSSSSLIQSRIHRVNQVLLLCWLVSLWLTRFFVCVCLFPPVTFTVVIFCAFVCTCLLLAFFLCICFYLFAVGIFCAFVYTCLLLAFFVHLFAHVCCWHIIALAELC